MKRATLSALSALAIGIAAPVGMVIAASAQVIQPFLTAAGTLERNDDHFIEIQATERPIDRLKVVCVTFHELSGVEVTNADGSDRPSEVNYGFEEFTVSFDEPIQPGESVRLVMLDSNVRGRVSGLTVPYQVFGTISTLDDDFIPLGTAVITVPEVTGR